MRILYKPDEVDGGHSFDTDNEAEEAVVEEAVVEEAVVEEAVVEEAVVEEAVVDDHLKLTGHCADLLAEVKAFKAGGGEWDMLAKTWPVRRYNALVECGINKDTF
jgi:hypothetical protein